MNKIFSGLLLLPLLTILLPTTVTAMTVRSPVIAATFEQLTQEPLAGTRNDAPMTAYPGGYNWLGTYFDGINGGLKQVLTTGSLNSPNAGVLWSKATCIRDLNNYCIDSFGTSETPAFTSFATNVTGVVNLWFLDLYWVAPGISTEVLAFIHEENIDNSGGRPGNLEGLTRIGLAWSSDGGDSWKYLGRIISVYGDPQPFNIQGSPYTINNGYFQIQYLDRDIDGLDGIGMSRASLDSVIAAARAGNVGTNLWSKYYNGGWTEPGLGGRSELPSYRWGSTHTQAIHSNYTGKYYMPFASMSWYNGMGGYYNASVKIYESIDGLNWDLSTILVDEKAATQGFPAGGYVYCSMADVNGTANHEAGQKFYVYCHKYLASTHLTYYAQYQWAVDLGPEADFYRQSTDFSSTQGPYWYYLVGTSLSDMTWNSAGFWQGIDPWAHIYGSYMHPGNSESAVLKWVAPKSGTVLISGTVRDADPACGDGISAQLLHGSMPIFSATIANGDTIGKSHNLTRNVAAGDALFFKVGANDNNSCDATFWDPSIVYAGPDVSLDVTPAALVNSAAAAFSFSSSDRTATFECKVVTGLDTGFFTPCSSPYTTPPLADGSHTFTVRAIDSTGNQGPLPANYTWAIDATPPDTVITVHPAKQTTANNDSFSFTSTETPVTFECKLDSNSWSDCTSGVTYNNLPLGSHSFEARAKDPAGNIDPSPASYLWTITTNHVVVTIGSNTNYFSTVSAAIASIPPGSAVSIRATSMVFNESLDLNIAGVESTFTGGCDCELANASGFTTIIGSLVISAGTHQISNIVIM